MFLFDATHTSHTQAQTGIQRVCRSLYTELAKGRKTGAVCYDPYLKSWRATDAGETATLRPGQAAGSSRGAKWPLHRRITGHARRLLGAKPALPAGAAFICPELFSARVGARLPEIFARVRGPRVAIFYDAIGLQYPELTPPGTVARLPAYLRELLLFDGVAAISETSAASLRDYWRWLGVSDTPVVTAIPLAIDERPSPPDGIPAQRAIPRLLCVSTLEGRKNHLALLQACERLWQEGVKFELQLLGLARTDTAAAALAKVSALQQAGRPVLFEGSVSDAALHTAYRECAFTIYPSLIEGFGLPVLESLQYGKPCICSGRGALAESTRDGGCVALDAVDAASLAPAIRRLLQNPAELAALGAEARARHFKSWPSYTLELTAWMEGLPRRG